MSYYDEILSEIKDAIAREDLDEASFLLKKEFSMPYIPSEVEAQLRQLQNEVRWQRSQKREPKEVSMEHLLHQLKGKPASQLSAVNALAERNLRSVADEIRDWLGKDPQPEAAAMMIELLAEQEVAQEFTVTRGGVEYTFYGDAVTPVTKSEGFIQAYRLLQEWLGKEPSLLDLARTVLVSKCYMALPLSYEASEGLELARQSCREVLLAMGMEEKMKEIDALSESVVMLS